MSKKENKESKAHIEEEMEENTFRLKEKTKDNNQTKKILITIIIILVLVILGVLGLGVFTYVSKVKKNQEPMETIEKFEKLEDKITIVDMESKKRPYAVMIDNAYGALDQFGVNSAQVIYEVPVEGGISRLLAIFKDVNVEKIGPLRSVRHYFLDFAKEYDAIMVHEGQSPRGGAEISSRGIDSVAYTYKLFTREPGRYSPHNAITSTERIKNGMEQRVFSDETKIEFPFKYTSLGVKLKNSKPATNISTAISGYTDIDYKYNKETKKYEKYEHDRLLTDVNTKEAMACTNLIILKINYSRLTGFGEGQGRIEFDTTQDMKGYYFTRGEYIPITAKKNTRDSKTVYKNLNGREIILNDGNLHVLFIPKSEDINVE